MRYLLDVNILLAWGWPDHEHHPLVVDWLQRRLQERDTLLLTSAIPQLGFVRVSLQRSHGQVTPQQAGEILTGLLNALGPRHHFLADDLPASRWPRWCQHARQTTDAHLLQLATDHGARLATLDQGIPGATLIRASQATWTN